MMNDDGGANVRILEDNICGTLRQEWKQEVKIKAYLHVLYDLEIGDGKIGCVIYQIYQFSGTVSPVSGGSESGTRYKNSGI